MKRVLTILFMCVILLVGCNKNNNSSTPITGLDTQSATADTQSESLDTQNTTTNNQNNNSNIQNTTLPTQKVNPTNAQAQTTSTTTPQNPPVSTPPTLVENPIKNTDIPKVNDNGVTTLKFKNTNSNEAIEALNGKQVSITGYLSTLSPLNGNFAYLMNMPYQSCPFCIPGSSTISNTLAVVAGNKSKIKFTDQPVTVVGTLETGTFTDEFGYEYSVRLNNVTVNKADVDKLSEAIKRYSLLAENGIVNDIYGCIMAADYSIYYNYYQLEKPGIIDVSIIDKVQSSLGQYNSKGEYDNLVEMLASLKSLCDKTNGFINENKYDEIVKIQPSLNNIFYRFSSWMSEGEL